MMRPKCSLSRVVPRFVSIDTSIINPSIKRGIGRVIKPRFILRELTATKVAIDSPKTNQRNFIKLSILIFTFYLVILFIISI